jgi:hypothetical protein
MFFNQARLPFKRGPVDSLIKSAAEYVKQNFGDDKIYYFNPDFAFQLELDPFDPNECNWGIGDKLKPSNSMEFGSVLIWDAHFAPNEGGVSLEAVENDERLQEIKTFLPLEKITVLGGYDYSIRIFKKVKLEKQSDDSNVFIRKLEINPEASSQVISLSGENVFEIPKGSEYSPNIVIYREELLIGEGFEGELEIEFKSDETIIEKDVLLVFSVENENKSMKYENVPITWNKNDSDWKTVKLTTRFSSGIPESSLIKMYIWNRNHKHIFIKNMRATITSY